MYKFKCLAEIYQLVKDNIWIKNLSPPPKNLSSFLERKKQRRRRLTKTKILQQSLSFNGHQDQQPAIPRGIFKINTSAFEQLCGFFFSRKNPRGRLADFRFAHPDITAI